MRTVRLFTPRHTHPGAYSPPPTPAQAFSLTTLFSQFAAGMGCWFIVGDDAYVGKEHIATPFHGTTKGGTMVRALAYPCRRARALTCTLRVSRRRRTTTSTTRRSRASPSSAPSA